MNEYVNELIFSGTGNLWVNSESMCGKMCTFAV